MSKMEIDLPQQLIEDTIRMEMVRTLSAENKNQLIESVVKHAMTQKKDNYSRTQTFFQESVNKMIQEEVKVLFGEWIRENREDIAKALRQYLTANKQKALTEFCEKLAGNISSYGINVSLKLSGDKE